MSQEPHPVVDLSRGAHQSANSLNRGDTAFLRNDRVDLLGYTAR